ncbi:multiple cyclophane-containing RiPP AmcA [Micromonospora sp. B11E3]
MAAEAGRGGFRAADNIAAPADPPLLTHAWRQLFERQVRDGDRR